MEKFNEVDKTLKRKNKLSEMACPVCGITIISSDIEQHYELEVDRLIKLQLNPKSKHKISKDSAISKQIAPECLQKEGKICSCPWISFQKVRENRHSRLKISRKKKNEKIFCRVCNKYPKDVNIHIEKYFRYENIPENDNHCGDENNVNVNDEQFEEYEWAGQKRVRASSLLEGGYSVSEFSMKNSKEETNDEELNVDEDDTHLYGLPQYSERNIIIPFSQANHKELDTDIYLRQLVSVQDISLERVENKVELNNENKNFNAIDKKNNCNYIDSTHSTTTKIICKNHKDVENEKHNITQIVESLKVKIREYESQSNIRNKCLICMDFYFKPVVSICCWHVHCENCWLRTLGARKLCPQCNMITSPTDLRRIFL